MKLLNVVVIIVEIINKSYSFYEWIVINFDMLFGFMKWFKLNNIIELRNSIYLVISFVFIDLVSFLIIIKLNVWEVIVIKMLIFFSEILFIFVLFERIIKFMLKIFVKKLSVC